MAFLISLHEVAVYVTFWLSQCAILRLFGYWGQNSRGAAHGADKTNFQKRILLHCNAGYSASCMKEQTQGYGFTYFRLLS